MRISDWSSDVCSSDLERVLPFAADESILDLAELEARHHNFDVINIKLDKCDGLTEGLLMARRARELGKRVMVGNMCGTSLAAAPAFVPGQFCDVVDLDGPIFLRQDRTRSEETTSELQSLLRLSYAVLCLTKKPPHKQQQ